MALQRRSLLQRCVLEALRLRGAGVTVRMAMSDLELPYGDGRTLSVRKVSCRACAGMCVFSAVCHMAFIFKASILLSQSCHPILNC